ncbi:unnamed protein product [Darwinula stevensoni]|uniref:FAM69 protein-kinase domain-containing protein n=1 Tax=Darwinula stevensoni TaxID=69355 RepID=A0A7R8WYS3_9CRUS|nr:unnamed protein product [Darwinula stevensoni]CAG0879726.1 unnamed protein product [Darwinula stevensoni]
MNRLIRRYASVALVILSVVLLCVFLKTRGTLEDLTEAGKCPACFGTSLCPDAEEGRLRLWGRSSASLLPASLLSATLLNVRNVYWGVWTVQDSFRGDKDMPVVFKKLAHDSELRELDRRICQAANMSSDCDVSTAGTRLSHSLDGDWDWDRGLSLVKALAGPTRSSDPSPLACPSRRLLTSMRTLFLGLAQEPLGLPLLLLLALNPEPILLEMMNEDPGGHVPHVFGYCGRVVVVEDAGDPLSGFLRSDWGTRAGLAVQLLDLARRLSPAVDGFAVYLMDLGYDNFLVAEGRLRLADVEHVVVVDTAVPPDHVGKETWETEHKSDPDLCDGCLGFRPEDLCSHRSSDHNFYAVCSVSPFLMSISRVVRRNDSSHQSEDKHK